MVDQQKLSLKFIMFNKIWGNNGAIGFVSCFKTLSPQMKALAEEALITFFSFHRLTNNIKVIARKNNPVLDLLCYLTGAFLCFMLYEEYETNGAEYSRTLAQMRSRSIR